MYIFMYKYIYIYMYIYIYIHTYAEVSAYIHIHTYADGSTLRQDPSVVVMFSSFFPSNLRSAILLLIYSDVFSATFISATFSRLL